MYHPFHEISTGRIKTTVFYGFKDVFLVDCMSCTVTIMVGICAAGLWNLTVATMGKQPIMLTRIGNHL
jgi:hypothetical protein